MNDHVPYTYLVGWSKHNRYYYGVRYAKDCNPRDLWVSYFTSSKFTQAAKNEKLYKGLSIKVKGK